jgi:two-component system sensor kinase FixL
MKGDVLLRVLVIEDSDVDFRLLERALGDSFTIYRAQSLASGLTMAAGDQYDLVILDLTLEDSRGYDTFEKARAALTGTPIMVLSGLEDEELALRAVSNGAQDYIGKSRLLEDPIHRAARYAIERWRADDVARKATLQYRALFDNLPTAAYTCDPDGLITYCNKKAVELWGRNPKLNDPCDRFIGSFRQFTTDGTHIAPEQSCMAKAIRELRRFEGSEILIELPDGERRAVLAHAHPVLDESGVLRGGINVLVDITSQRRTERQLRESERFAKSIVDSLAARIAILDQTGTILAVNSAWQRFSGDDGISSTDRELGTSYLEACEQAGCRGHEVARAAAAGIRTVLQGDKTQFYLEYPCHSPAEERWCAMRVTPFDGDGPTRVVVSHEDITPRKLAERLASEQWGLREAVAGMEQVLGVVGHELRTPLAALRAISEFLTTDGASDTAEANGFLRNISEEVDRMSETVNNLLEAARLNSGRARWNWSEFELADIVDEAISAIQPLIDPANVLVTAEVHRPIQMLGDADAIRRLVINLLNNARKHTVLGRIVVGIRQETNETGAWIELTVQDTGCGIPREVAARLGEAFALNSGVVGGKHVSGTGLGLAICKAIATAHGGALRIESIQKQGTTVTARLRANLQCAASGDTVHITCSGEVAA